MNIQADASAAAAEFTARLDGLGDAKTKAWWEGYMKGVIPFRGIKMPVLRAELLPWWQERVAPQGLAFEKAAAAAFFRSGGRRTNWRACSRSNIWPRAWRPPTWTHSKRFFARGCCSTGTTPTGSA